MKRWFVLRMAAAAALFFTGVAHAGDYCLSFPATPSFVIVGKGFSIPPKGNCKAWVGFSPQSNHDSPSTGTACTSSDGTTMNMTITTSFPEGGGGFETESIALNLPSQSGTDNYTYGFGTTLGSGGPVTANGAKCSKNTIPAQRFSPSSDSEAWGQR